MKKPIISSILLILFLFTSCTSDNDDMNDMPDNTVTYKATIKVIIDDNCLNCHADPPLNGASMPLMSL